MSIGNIDAGIYSQITASTVVRLSQGALKSIFVSSASATPTITIYDANSASTTLKIIDTFTPVSSTSYSFNVTTLNGVYVVIGGTVSCTVNAV